MASMVIIRFGEFTLKGKNRSYFEDTVLQVIRRRMKVFPDVEVQHASGRVFLKLNGTPFEKVATVIDTIFGLSSYSPAESCALDTEAIRETALAMMKSLDPRPRTFKVKVRRPYKGFPLNSMEMNHVIGRHVLVNMPGLKVDLHHPDAELNVEIRDNGAYVFCKTHQAQGGFPLGTNGRAMLLLSGGIDSPVAGFLAMRRGLHVEAVHFHSFPYTSERAQQKVRELAEQLAVYADGMTLHMVPFAEIQTRLKQLGKEKFLITMVRRAMMRITSRLADMHKCKAIVTGESLGQVASQTLASLTAIERVSSLPVLRPLIMMDKQEIIHLAEKIGTFPISIQPYEDCCTLFVPKSPSTNPNIALVEQIESKADWMEEEIAEAIRRTETIRILPSPTGRTAGEADNAAYF
jgi:thiamine biosynthesis protein ThiI